MLRPRGKLPDNAFDNVALRDFCAQRTSEEIAAGLAWLEKAALGGDLEAMQRLERLYRTGSDKQVDVLNAIWEQGSIMALYKLASAYRFRRAQAGADSQDAIKALASTWLYVQLNESAFRLHSTHSDFLDALHKDLARQLQETNPSTHADAIALARTMLSQNARCCVIP